MLDTTAVDAVLLLDTGCGLTIGGAVKPAAV
jgi:hypothetical protein